MNVASISATDLLRIDPATETQRIACAIHDVIFRRFRRKGAVVAVSGGIDSSVVAALCVRALGADRVIALFLPDADSSDENLRLGATLTQSLGIRSFTEDIRQILQAAGCYQRRDDSIRSVVPEYREGYKSKIVLPSLGEGDRYAIFSLVVQSPTGHMWKVRLSKDAYLGIVASTNFKQRTRKMMEYYYADRFHYAVAGTPNRLEYDQGFFVKNGDGAADLKPIAHLYKSQVYQLAAYLDIPPDIQKRTPTTDTYTLEQSQEEFYFSVPLRTLDICIYGKDHGLSVDEVATIAGVTCNQVQVIFASIEAKRKAALYLRQSPVLFDDVSTNAEFTRQG
jgi:NAD+ synthase